MDLSDRERESLVVPPSRGSKVLTRRFAWQELLGCGRAIAVYPRSQGVRCWARKGPHERAWQMKTYDEPFLTVRGIIRTAGVQPGFIDARTCGGRGGIPCVRVGGKLLRFRWSEVMAWVDQSREKV